MTKFAPVMNSPKITFDEAGVTLSGHNQQWGSVADESRFTLTLAYGGIESIAINSMLGEPRVQISTTGIHLDVVFVEFAKAGTYDEKAVRSAGYECCVEFHRQLVGHMAAARRAR